MIYKHIVMFSGGVCSWAAAKRVVAQHGTDGVVLLFADTQMEDEDLYRFLDEASANVGVPLIRITAGKTPWQLMREQRIIANSMIDVCSRILKRELLDKWRDEHGHPDQTTIHLGLSWDEDHRVRRVNERCAPWKYSAPMSEKPWMSKDEMFAWLKAEGIDLPKLYKLGFAHNNCGGFCVKAGQASFKRLWETMPERYLWHEQQERELREIVGNHSIMKCRKGGVSKPLTMEEFRKRITCNPANHDQFDLGGCGCALNTD